MNVIILNFLLKTLKLIHAKWGVLKITKMKYAQIKVTLRPFPIVYLSRFLIRVSACKDSLVPRLCPKNRKRGQMIGEFVSVTRMHKQRSPISIVHQSPANARHHCHMYVGDRDDAITSYILYHIAWLALLALCACDGVTFRMVSFCNLIGFSNFWEGMVDRKYMETLPGPFPNFWGGACGRS